MLVDPDGEKIKLTGNLDLQQMYVEQLQATVGGRKFLKLTFDYNGNVGYKPGRKFDSEGNNNYNTIASIIDNDKISVNVELKEFKEFNEKTTIGGSFMGSKYDAETGTVKAMQIVDPVFAEAFDMTTGNYGALALHELTEAFIGGNMSLEQKRSIPNAYEDNATYEEAHGKATSIPNITHRYLDKYGRDENIKKAELIKFEVDKKVIQISPFKYDGRIIIR